MKQTSIKKRKTGSRISRLLSAVLAITLLTAFSSIRSFAYIVYSDTMNRAVFTITTDSHAGGWEKAKFKVDYIDKNNKEQTKEWDITSEMEKGDKITIDLFESYSKPTKMYLYMRFGGGFTIRNQSGNITYSFQRNTLREVSYSAWSSPFSAYDKEEGYDLPKITPVELTLGNGSSREIESMATAIGEAQEDSKATVKLMSNAEIMDKSIEVPTSCDLTIDLNGYAITRKYPAKDYSKGSLFHIGEGAALTVTDSSKDRDNGAEYNGKKYKGGTLYGGNSESGGGCFYIEEGGKLTMTGGTIADCKADSQNGGAIFCEGKLSLSGASIIRCSAGYFGGAIAVTGNSDISMEKLTIDSCEATDGGAICFYKFKNVLKVTKFDNCTIKNCKAKDYGGGLNISDKTELTANSLTIKECRAKNGGGVYNESQNEVTLNKTKIEQCYADKLGGGVCYMSDTPMTLNNADISYCKSSQYGGGIYLLTSGKGESEININKSDIHNCTADKHGGGLYIYDEGFDSAKTKKTIITDTDIRGNLSDLGGGIYAESHFVYLIHSRIKNNQAKSKNGGGVYVDSMRDIEIAGVTVIRDNTANGDTNNLCLQNGSFSSAKMYSGGLEDGAYIGISTTSNGSATVSKNISQYQVSKYLHTDDYVRSFSVTNTKEVSTPLVASMLPENFSLIIIIGGVVVIAALIVFLIFRKRRKEGRKNDEAKAEQDETNTDEENK